MSRDSRENGSIIGVVNNPTNVTAVGIWSLADVLTYDSNNSWPGKNSILFETPGTYTWVAPSNVTSVSVVCVGGGGTGYIGSGGGLGWKNNITVTPGSSYSVKVGSGTDSSTNAGDSWFINSTTVAGLGGDRGAWSSAPGGGYVGDGGGNGGATGAGNGGGAGGGGAGGYTGNGGKGGDAASGGTGSGGGGVGVFGQGFSGSGGGNGSTGSGGGGGGGGAEEAKGAGGGGSGGTNGTFGGNGGSYGGGRGWFQTSGHGAVRIIWPGNTRLFPSTNVGG